MVVILSPSCMAARVRQEFTRRPFTCTVARAALAVIAALLGAGEIEGLAQSVEEGGARIEGESDLLAVDLEADGDGASDGLGRQGGRGCGGLGARQERRGGGHDAGGAEAGQKGAPGGRRERRRRPGRGVEVALWVAVLHRMLLNSRRFNAAADREMQGV